MTLEHFKNDLLFNEYVPIQHWMCARQSVLHWTFWFGIFADSSKEEIADQNVAFTEQELQQAIGLAEFSYNQLKT